MGNRNGFAVRQLAVAGAVIGFLLIVAIAVPNVLRQTRNSSRTQDVHILGVALKDAQIATNNAAMPDSCNNTQAQCFIRTAQLAYYDNTSSSETVITYYRNNKPFDKFSPQLDAADNKGADKQVVIHSYAKCGPSGPTGDGASRGDSIAQYAVETLTGISMACKQL